MRLTDLVRNPVLTTRSLLTS